MLVICLYCVEKYKVVIKIVEDIKKSLENFIFFINGGDIYVYNMDIGGYVIFF